MNDGSTGTSARRASTRAWAIAIALLVVGLVGHVLAAKVNGGSTIAYQHHVFGFFLILVVTGAVIALLGLWLWRNRPGVTLVGIGVVQAVLGLLVYLGEVRK